MDIIFNVSLALLKVRISAKFIYTVSQKKTTHSTHVDNFLKY